MAPLVHRQGTDSSSNGHVVPAGSGKIGAMRRPTALFLGAAVLLVAGCSSAAEGETEDNTPETETQDQDTGTAAEPLSGDDGPLVVGHRGATGTSPENTLVSIAEAVEMGADIIEIDVQLSSRSEEHTSELQSRGHLVCRLLLAKKKSTKCGALDRKK